MNQMKNQTFNIKRFGTYALYNLRMNSKTYWSLLGSISLMIFLVLFLNMLNDRHFGSHNWSTLFLLTGGISSVIIIASSFPYLRKKETQMSYYLQPASILEKFSFEFLLRYVGFFIVFPTLFYVLGKAVYPIVEGVRAIRGLGMQGVEAISSLNLDVISRGAPESARYLGAGVLLFVMSLVFSGTTVFMKSALVKTVGFVMGVGAFVAYYFYTIFETFGRGTPYLFVRLENIDENNAIVIGTSVLAFFTVWVLSYGFFKLKEREV